MGIISSHSKAKSRKTSKRGQSKSTPEQDAPKQLSVRAIKANINSLHRLGLAINSGDIQIECRLTDKKATEEPWVKAILTEGAQQVLQAIKNHAFNLASGLSARIKQSK